MSARTLFASALILVLCPSAHGERRALVIANQRYTKGPLENPVRDGQLVASALRQAGFRVRFDKDLTRAGMRRSVNAFVGDIEKDDDVVVYYVGHGLQVRGKNFLLGINFDATNEEDARDEAYPLSTLTDRVGRTLARHKVLMVDACRDEPFSRSWSRGAGSRGFAVVDRSPIGVHIEFSARPGMLASDGGGAPNGPFARALAQHMLTPNLELGMVFRRVRQTVWEQTGGKQRTSTERSDLVGSFYFRRDDDAGDAPDETDETVSRSTVTVRVTDRCRGGTMVPYKLFDADGDQTWPTGEATHLSKRYGATYRHRISCQTGHTVCFGAAMADLSWGVGLDNGGDCNDCCVKCREGAKARFVIRCARVTLRVTDSCDKDERVHYRIFNRSSGATHPQKAEDHFEVSSFGATGTHSVNCIAGQTLCYGARSSAGYWGVDLDGSEQNRPGACITCRNGHVSHWRFGCGEK